MATNYNITSANSTLVMNATAAGLTNVVCDEYAADRMFDIEAVTNGEFLFTADGKLKAGYVFNPKPVTISVMPTSNFAAALDRLVSVESTLLDKVQINFVLSIPSLGVTYNLVGGFLNTWGQAPSAGRVLQPRVAQFTFESITKG